MLFNPSPLFEIDFYKSGHYAQYPEGTVEIFSNFTPRSSRTENKFVIFFGLQAVLKDLHENWKKNFFEKDIDVLLEEYKSFIDATIYPDAVTLEHIKAVHELQYLPIEVFAVPEGSMVPVGIPVFCIRNTHKSAYWLVNYLETKLSNALWKPITSATTAFSYLCAFHGFAEETGADKNFIGWQGHDFSYRGMSGNEDAIMSAMAHLTSFYGTDTVPAIPAITHYYDLDWKTNLVGGSVPATEHSVMCAGGMDDEYGTFKRLITEVCPKGIVSIVSDTWDYWQVITNFLPKLKEDILARDGRIVIRPDSGDPVKIICGYEIFTDRSDLFCCGDLSSAVYYNADLDRYELYEEDNYDIPVDIIPEHIAKGTFQLLWDIFGGSVNGNGFKILNPKIGLIYGDSITTERQEQILQQLMQKGFTADNLVLGIGSFTYEYVTRDTYGMAMKTTNAVIEKDGVTVSVPIFKDPKTNIGSFSKKSAKGYLKVISADGGLKLIDQISSEDLYAEDNVMKVVYVDNQFKQLTTFTEIRDRVKSNLE